MAIANFAYMGEVYLAEDTTLKRPVALKRIAERLWQQQLIKLVRFAKRED
jgi:serine/threonine protein kinase